MDLEFILREFIPDFITAIVLRVSKSDDLDSISIVL